MGNMDFSGLFNGVISKDGNFFIMGLYIVG